MTPSPGISRVLEHIATKSQRLHLFFGVKWWYFRFRGTSVCARNPRRQPNYRKYKQLCWFYKYTIMLFQKQYRGFMTMWETSKSPVIMADDTSCRKSKMAARTGSSNIYETMTRIIKIPTANLQHSTMANSQEVYLGDSNYDRQSEMAAETGNTYTSETMWGTVKISTTNLMFKIMYRWKIVLASEYNNYRQPEISAPNTGYNYISEALTDGCSEISCNVKWNVYLAMEIPDCVSFISG